MNRLDVFDEREQSDEILEIPSCEPSMVRSRLQGDSSGKRWHRQAAGLDAHDVDFDQAPCARARLPPGIAVVTPII